MPVAAVPAKQSYTIRYDREEDGRWIAEVAELPGVIVYGKTRQEAARKVTVLALRAVADMMEEAEEVPSSVQVDVA